MKDPNTMPETRPGWETFSTQELEELLRQDFNAGAGRPDPHLTAAILEELARRTPAPAVDTEAAWAAVRARTLEQDPAPAGSAAPPPERPASPRRALGWRRILALAAAVAMMVCVLVISASRTASDQEIDQIRAALIGAQEVQVQMGMFSSEDGTTSSLTEAELETLATNFDQKVDQYYAQDTYSNEFYKWLNRDCLFRSHQTVVDNCIAGGVTQCDITNLSLSNYGTEATVSATVTIWNKWVTMEEDGSYSISNPINQDFLEVKMVKEDGTWKLAETLSLEKGMTGYDDSSLSIDSATTSTKSASSVTSNPKNKQALEEIAQNKSILAQKYNTFQEAKNAVNQIDVETGNYIALLN